MRIRRLVLVFLVGVGGALSACSSSKSTPSASAYVGSLCNAAKLMHTVKAQKVAGVSSAWTVTSFDGTPIRAYWFPSGGSAKHATVLMGPGLGEMAATLKTGPSLFGGPTIRSLLKAGFNVLTWDPRGFGPSGGKVELDRESEEARDVTQLIDWVATQPGVKLNGAGDPAIGMVGASYGGGIQFTSAAADCRIDAIVPTIAWHSLVTSMDPSGTVKAGWAKILNAALGQKTMHPAPQIANKTAVLQSGLPTATLSHFLTSAGPQRLVTKVTAPTLIVQGTVDNLFPLEEGVTNFLELRGHGVPVHMIWFCGGHGACLTPMGTPKVIEKATIAWLEHWVDGKTGVTLGPTFQFVDQNGHNYAHRTYPLSVSTSLVGTGKGTLTLTPASKSGPVTTLPRGGDPLNSVAASATPAEAKVALNVTLTATKRALVVGAPKLSLTYKGTTPKGAAPERVFAQIVDEKTGLVLGNQITPIDMVLDGKVHTTTVPLEIIVASLNPGAKLTLQLVATTVAFSTPRLGGQITFTKIHLSLPVATHIAPK